MSGDIFLNYYNKLQGLVNKWLEQAVIADTTLKGAMRYSVLAGGKRFRPVLSLFSGEMLELEKELLRAYAVALEFIHTASLIHDDLPALDNDSLRRGKPTCHKVYGEAVAVLAGDALISEAFYLLTTADEIRPDARSALAGHLAGAMTTLCHGQVMDLGASACLKRSSGGSSDEEAEKKELETRHLSKTGALIRAAASGPAAFLTGPERDKISSQLGGYGEQLGLLFQITDDILDVTASSETLGKDAQTDSRQGTPTYVSVYGLNGAQELARETAKRALSFLDEFDDKAVYLRALCSFVQERKK